MINTHQRQVEPPLLEDVSFLNKIMTPPVPAESKKSEFADADMTATKDAKSKLARRRSMPTGVVEGTTLDVRIWDWSTRMSFPTTILV